MGPTRARSRPPTTRGASRARPSPRSWTASMRRGPAAHGGTSSTPTLSPDPDTQRWWARYLRVGASPNMARDLMLMNAQIDVRDLLPAIGCPTLVLHRRDDRWVEVGNGHYLAAYIAGAKFVELSGADHR